MRAHQVALSWRERGLPLATAMPNGVVGANDHSVFGYFLRLYLLGASPPMGFGGDAVLALVDVKALAEGLCLVAATDDMWDRIVAEERALMARRQGFLERLRHQPVVEG